MPVYTRGSAEIDLGVVASWLWSDRWWIAASAVVITAGFGVAAYTMTPVYRATAVLIDASADRSNAGGLTSALGQFGGLASLAGINLGSGNSRRDESLAVLKSRAFTEAFIGDEGLLPELFPERWDAAGKRWKGPEDAWPTLAQGFSYFDKHVRTVTVDRTTGLIALDVEWRDRHKAADWANGLVARLNAEMRARAVASTNESVGYLEREFGATASVDTRQAISRLMETQINQRMLANVTQEFAFRVVDKALPPDLTDVVRPKKALLLAVGFVLGLTFGIFCSLVARVLGRNTLGRRA